MAITPSTIKANKGHKRSAKRVGRGNASGKGNYSARGMKGQRSRSGGKGGLRQLGFKAQLQKIPKVRGFKSPHTKPETVTLGQIEKLAQKVTDITPYELKKAGLITRVAAGAKVVATGTISTKVQLKNVLATKAAAEAIEKAGGKLVY